MQGVLDGIRVLDFGRFIAGPYCGQLLADFGADVIRMDKVGGSEDRFLLPVAETGEGPLFFQINRNKKSMTLDSGQPEGRKVLEKLIKTTDVVVANLPWEILPKLGLDYETLKSIKPDIILATMSTFGHEGPYARRVGFDGIAQAMSGSMYMTGWEDKPVRAASPYCDFGTALVSAYGIMLALRHRDKTGEGQVVEGTLLRTGLTFSNAMVIEQALTKPDRIPTGNLAQTAGPADVYKAKDGTILVNVISNPLFRRWARLMGEEEQWTTDPRFKDDVSRGDHGPILSERMQRWVGERTVEEAITALEGARIPAGPVLKPQQVLEDEHVIATGMLHPTEFPGLDGLAPIMESQVKLSQTPGEIRHRAPLSGEHTDEVLNELGLTEEQIAGLRDNGII
ncbi:MAG: CaiB/BaiF CoA transferase family protein [Alphaproteobacteria bacterium]